VVETRGRIDSSYQAFVSEAGSHPFAKPLVVLVDQGSASAAEILAGAIQDHDMGLVVGTPTWGKGLVQTVYNLSYGTALALTTAKYYTPAGRLIQRDYSSYYDYYTHFNALAQGEGDEAEELEEPPTVEAEGPSFETDLGRAVFGGGGITPDVEVELPETSLALQRLFLRNTFFDFAVELFDRSEVKDLDWQPPEDLVEQFKEWLEREEIFPAEEIAEMFEEPEVVDRSRRQIHADVMTAAFGTEASHRVLAQGDVQIQRALELFDRANTLLAERLERGDKMPRIPPTVIDERAERGVPGGDSGSR
jgi:carboxyl-terminal processing protease